MSNRPNDASRKEPRETNDEMTCEAGGKERNERGTTEDQESPADKKRDGEKSSGMGTHREISTPVGETANPHAQTTLVTTSNISAESLSKKYSVDMEGEIWEPAGQQPVIEVDVLPYNIKADTLLDTGSRYNIISLQLYDIIMRKAREKSLQTPELSYMAQGGLDLQGLAALTGTDAMTTLTIRFGPLKMDVKFIITQDPPYPVILGTDALLKGGINTDLYNGVLKIHEFPRFKYKLNMGQHKVPRGTARFQKDIPAHSEALIPITIQNRDQLGKVDDQVWVATGLKEVVERSKLLIARILLNPKNPCIRVANVGSSNIRIHKGSALVSIRELSSDQVTVLKSGNKEQSKNRKRPRHASMATQERRANGQAVRHPDNANLSDKALDEKVPKDLPLAEAMEHLQPEELRQLKLLIADFPELWGWNQEGAGKAHKQVHKIETGEAQPISQVPYRTGPQGREIIQKHVEDMEKDKVIEPSTSPWASPVVLADKKDGGIRFCVDYRKLNAVTKKDVYPLPRIDDLLGALEGAQHFSTFDLKCGYWQIPLREEDKEKTAFISPAGLWQFRVMPFGLCNAPATFQRMMDVVLAGLKWQSCLVYLDDVIVFSKTFEEHLDHLRAMLSRLVEYSLFLAPKKCFICRQQLEYLGHIVSKDGLKTDPKKIEAVADFPTPKCVKDVRSFLGVAGYYRRFVKDYAAVANPLFELLKEKTEWEWTDAREKAFQELKRRLISSPILRHPDFSKPFIVDTDASLLGLGAILMQQDEGAEYVIAYASRALTEAEKKWSVTELEALAIVWACELFRPYVHGAPFTIRTDHFSLQWLNTAKNNRIARWGLRLQDFMFKVLHRKGTQCAHVDALSRNPTDRKAVDSNQESIQGNGSANPEVSLPVNDQGGCIKVKVDTYAEFCLAVAAAEEGDLEEDKEERWEARQEGDDTDDDEGAYVEVPVDIDVLLSDEEITDSGEEVQEYRQDDGVGDSRQDDGVGDSRQDDGLGESRQGVESRPRLPQDSGPCPQGEDAPRSRSTQGVRKRDKVYNPVTDDEGVAREATTHDFLKSPQVAAYWQNQDPYLNEIITFLKELEQGSSSGAKDARGASGARGALVLGSSDDSEPEEYDLPRGLVSENQVRENNVVEKESRRGSLPDQQMRDQRSESREKERRVPEQDISSPVRRVRMVSVEGDSDCLVATTRAREMDQELQTPNNRTSVEASVSSPEVYRSAMRKVILTVLATPTITSPRSKDQDGIGDSTNDQGKTNRRDSDSQGQSDKGDFVNDQEELRDMSTEQGAQMESTTEGRRRTERRHARWKKVYRLEKGILFRMDMTHGEVQPIMRLVVPRNWQRTIVWDIHQQICHLSVQRTYKAVSRKFYWENLLSTVKKFVAECPKCQVTKIGPRRLVPPLLSLRKQGPWDTVGMDIYGPLPKTKQGYRFILVLIDHFTKWPEIIPMRYITSEAVAEVLTRRIFPRHGTPKCILTDRGPQFVSAVFQKLMKLYGVVKLYTSAYHPQGNGIAEAFMKILGNSLRTLVNKRLSDWDKYCEQIALAYRATPHPSTGETPFYLMHGRDLKLPMERMVEELTMPVLPLTGHESDLKAHLLCLQEAHREAHEALRRVHQVSSHRYDEARRDVHYRVGDLVHVKLSFHELQEWSSSKLAPRWSEPERIAKILDNGRTFDVENLLTGSKRRVHAVRLKPHLTCTGQLSPEDLKGVTQSLRGPPIWEPSGIRDYHEHAILQQTSTDLGSEQEREIDSASSQPSQGQSSYGFRRTVQRRAQETIGRQERLGDNHQ